MGICGSMRKSIWFLSAVCIVCCVVSVYAAESGTTVSSSLSSNLQGQPSEPPSGEQRGNKGGPGGEHRAPPQCAINACEGKAVGSACQITGPRGNETGTCDYTPDKKYFACKPPHMQRPPDGKDAPGKDVPEEKK
jgi:hypothetical protein